MKIVVLDGYTLNPGDLSWSQLEQLGDLVVHDRTPPELVAERIGDAQAVFTNKTVLTRDTSHNARTSSSSACWRPATTLSISWRLGSKAFPSAIFRPMARWRSRSSPRRYFSNCAITLAGTAKTCAPELGRSMMNFATGSTRCSNSTARHWAWSDSAIGQAFARIAQALGMSILAHDQYPNHSLESSTLCYVTLDELYTQSDVISLHCPLFDNNKGMINEETISRMKPGVLLINTSSGPLIVEQDLAVALKAGKIAGAALDVLSSEPAKADNPLLDAPNCIVTPHIAWATKEARLRIMSVAIENIAQFQNGTPQNVVNP